MRGHFSHDNNRFGVCVMVLIAQFQMIVKFPENAAKLNTSGVRREKTDLIIGVGVMFSKLLVCVLMSCDFTSRQKFRLKFKNVNKPDWLYRLRLKLNAGIRIKNRRQHAY